MNILIIGGGGREHAMAWKISQSPLATNIYIAPGNAGTLNEPKCSNIAIPANDIASLIQFSKSNDIELVIVGPEEPLVLGIKNSCEKENILCFGPCKEAAQLEGSKIFAKDFMKKYDIPTADYEVFLNYLDAIKYIKQCTYPIVIKADGLAAGKGVIIVDNQDHAENTLDQIFNDQQFGEAGNKVVIEEYLDGEELSFIAIVNDELILPLASSQDHKQRDNNDKGPNTGGMGAYSPAPLLNNILNEYIIHNIMQRTADGLRNENIPYHGFLYAGLMIGKDSEPKVLEFNCRLGDPETQPILMRMNSDLLEVMLNSFNKNNTNQKIDWIDQSAIGVVMASHDYPYDYPRGEIIYGLENIDTKATKVFHAGTTNDGNQVKTNGGRVLCITSLGKTLAQAKELAYQSVKSINWKSAFYRNDIGFKGIREE
jgi:phosphoribosylamine--glycine ligase